AIIGVDSEEFTVRLGATDIVDVVVTLASDIEGDQIVSDGGSPISTVTIPAESLLATFRLLPASSGTRTVSVAASGDAEPHGPGPRRPPAPGRGPAPDPPRGRAREPARPGGARLRGPDRRWHRLVVPRQQPGGRHRRQYPGPRLVGGRRRHSAVHLEPGQPA